MTKHIFACWISVDNGGGGGGGGINVCARLFNNIFEKEEMLCCLCSFINNRFELSMFSL